MARPTPPPPTGLSRVPYLPGLDGLRAVAVVAVMIYHANHSWLEGGFLGVEVFFVISGYLITLLLIGEHERNGRVSLRQFWVRRFRRLLPALFVMMALLAVYIAAFYPDARGRTRGDFLGGIFYVSNWYQIVVGQGYSAGEAFVPLRHLWSLAVEEQYYVVWPLVMLVILRRSRRALPQVGLRLLVGGVAVSVVMAVVFVSGDVGATCSAEQTNGYWTVFGRCISVNDMLYLGSFSRAGGLLLGSGFAMLWRPAAIMRGPLRDKGGRLDAIAVLGLAILVSAMWMLHLQRTGRNFGQQFNPWLFRGGFLVVGVATLLVIAAATHQGALTGRMLGNPLFRWIGTRSYGLYLYHWPIYQIIRKQTQIAMSPAQVALAMVATVPITELSYRFIETPIRLGRVRVLMRALRDDRRRLAGIGSVAAVVALAACSFAVAGNECLGAVERSLCDNAAQQARSTVPASTSPATVAPGSTVVASTTIPATTLPPEPQRFVAIGDSVMAGAAAQLRAAGVYTDAAENRGPKRTAEAISNLRNAGIITPKTVVVLQVGTNGMVEPAAYTAIMDLLPADAVAGVIFLTVRAADAFWIEGNNQLIRALPAKYPHVRLIDWEKESQQVELCPDGAHLLCGGTGPATFYAGLVFNELGIAAAP